MVGGVDAKELRAPVFNIVHGSFVDWMGNANHHFLKRLSADLCMVL